MRTVLFVALLLWAQASPCQQPGIDTGRSTVAFRIKNFGLEVQGSLGNVRGSVVFDRNNLASASFSIAADANTVNTGIALRDRHLQKSEYLDAEKYQTLEFVSTAVKLAKKADEVLVTGNLTIKNVKRQIEVLVRVTPLQGVTNFSGSFTVNRLDYTVGKSSLSLGDEVVVDFSLVL
jgi:polyisoprenoid-binding protein YceI